MERPDGRHSPLIRFDSGTPFTPPHPLSSSPLSLFLTQHCSPSFRHLSLSDLSPALAASLFLMPFDLTALTSSLHAFLTFTLMRPHPLRLRYDCPFHLSLFPGPTRRTERKRREKSSFIKSIGTIEGKMRHLVKFSGMNEVSRHSIRLGRPQRPQGGRRESRRGRKVVLEATRHSSR